MSKTDDDLELVHGSGNVFRDFGYPDADVQQTKALLAAQIIGILDDEGRSTSAPVGRSSRKRSRHVESTEASTLVVIVESSNSYGDNNQSVQQRPPTH